MFKQSLNIIKTNFKCAFFGHLDFRFWTFGFCVYTCIGTVVFFNPEPVFYSRMINKEH